MLSLKAALAEARKGGIFGIRFCSFDEKRKKGGEMVTFPECKILYSPKSSNAKHLENGTINVELLNDGLSTGTVRSVHVDLITRFNEEKITL